MIMRAPLSADDYQRADKVMLLLMQPQVKSLLDSLPVSKKKAKNSQQGISTVPKEFLDRPIVGHDSSNNLASISLFKHEGIFFTEGRFSKQLKRILGTEKLPVLLPTCKLAKLLMVKSHNVAHMS